MGLVFSAAAFSGRSDRANCAAVIVRYPFSWQYDRLLQSAISLCWCSASSFTAALLSFRSFGMRNSDHRILSLDMRVHIATHARGKPSFSRLLP